jgi:hypothetical protein
MVHDRFLDEAHLQALKTLILPNIAALSDRQCDQLRAFVARGGSIVATFETSLYNEWGEPRQNFGLADLFEVTFKGRVEGPMQNSYLRLETSVQGDRHPLLRDLEDAPRIINSVRRIEVEPARPFPNPPLTLIPSYPDLPMEKVFPRTARTDIAQVFISDRAAGSGDPPPASGRVTGGRVVYFPGDIDRTFWEVLSVDHLKLLRNAVTWATDEAPLVTVTGPGVLDVTVWEQKDSLIIHLVNLTNPMMMKGPVRELIPVGEQRVQVRLPDGTRPIRVRLLAADKLPAFEHQDQQITLTVPSILDHEIVVMQWGRI